jgi:very-short-patch-repair endonuclease
VQHNRSSGEKKLLEVLRQIFSGLRIKEQYHIGERLLLDFYIPNLDIGFEYDGIQHFEFSTLFHKDEYEFKRQKQRDRRKEELCDLRGITLVRVKYDEDLTEELLREKIEDVGFGTGEISEDATRTYKERKPKQKIPKRKKYNWPKGKKIPSRPFPKRKK